VPEPPVGITVAVPSSPPKQLGVLDVAVAARLSHPTRLTVTSAVDTHPLASVTVTV